MLVHSLSRSHTPTNGLLTSMLLIVLLSRNGKTAALYYLIVVGRVVSRHAYCQKVVIEWFGHAVSAEYVRMNDFDGADKDVRSR